MFAGCGGRDEFVSATRNRTGCRSEGGRGDFVGPGLRLWSGNISEVFLGLSSRLGPARLGAQRFFRLDGPPMGTFSLAQGAFRRFDLSQDRSVGQGTSGRGYRKLCPDPGAERMRSGGSASCSGETVSKPCGRGRPRFPIPPPGAFDLAGGLQDPAYIVRKPHPGLGAGVAAETPVMVGAHDPPKNQG